MHKKNFETEAGKQSDSHPSTSPATQYKTVEREGASELNRNEAAAASGLRKPDRCPNEAITTWATTPGPGPALGCQGKQTGQNGRPEARSGLIQATACQPEADSETRPTRAGDPSQS